MIMIPWILLCVVLSVVHGELAVCPRGGVSCDKDPAVDPSAVCEDADHGMCCVYPRPVPHSARCLCRAGWAGTRCQIALSDGDWSSRAQEKLMNNLKQERNTNVARNVILFVGDGMGVSTVTAARIYHGQQQQGHAAAGEENVLSFERFPYTGLSKTYNVNQQVPDSAGTAVAMLTGHKVNAGTVGVNSNVMRYDCEAVKGNTLDSIVKWSQAAGKRTGIVTTTRLTHATPAAAYARSAERFWESDADFLDYYGNDWRADVQKHNCTDIAHQLVHEEPGMDINVLLGGGRVKFMPKQAQDPEYPSKNGSRTDSRDLIDEWKQLHAAHKARYVWNKEQFNNVDDEDTDYLLGLFEPGHMNYEHVRQPDNEPSLQEMVTKAIRILSRGDQGYFLLVEGGRIDHGHHAGFARTALDETVAFHRAIQTAVDLTSSDDTLITVTADHSHGFSMSGYPSRGNDILGLVDTSDIEPSRDGMHRTTLAYVDGPGARNRTGRTDPATEDTTAFNYKIQANVLTTEETHGGEDVAIYARGPMAHLLTGVHEQHFIAHAMAYASCVGSNTQHCDNRANSAARAADSCSILRIFIGVGLLFAIRYYEE